MSRLMSRVTRLETRPRQPDASILGDDEVLEAMKLGTYESHHMDALFRVIEPATLGYLLMWGHSLRSSFGALLGSWQRPCYPMQAAYWVVAAGEDIQLDDDYNLARWEERFGEPTDESASSRAEDWHIWDAHTGIVKRLFRKHGLENLRSVVKALSDATVEDYENLIDEFVPRTDEARREQMSRISAPLRPFLGWFYNPFPLLVLSPDADEFWYIKDNTGQRWTPLRRRRGFDPRLT